MQAIERPQALADARATGEVHDLARGVGERGVDVANLELARDPRQPGAEDERLGAPVAVRDAVEELQEDAGVELHRAADVGEDDQRAALELAALVMERERDAAVARGGAQHAPHVEAGAPARPDQTERLADRQVEPDVAQRPRERVELVARALAEVLPPEELERTRRPGLLGDLDLGGTRVRPLGHVRDERGAEERRAIVTRRERDPLGAVGLLGGGAEERGEEIVEDRQVLAAHHERGPRRQVHVARRHGVHPCQGLRERLALLDAHGEPGAAERPGEADDVVVERSRSPSQAWSARSCSTSAPRTRSMSS